MPDFRIELYKMGILGVFEKDAKRREHLTICCYLKNQCPYAKKEHAAKISPHKTF